MGKEINTSTMRIKQFLGINQRVSDMSIDPREAAGMENFSITEESLIQRKGSEVLTTVFKDKTDTNVKVPTGLYEGTLGTTIYQVGNGGDAFKQWVAGAWTDRTGAIVLTDSADLQFSYATFIDTAVADVIIGGNGTDAPFKWTGAGAATALAVSPGNFNFPVVHKNKLWVAVGDIIYFSGIRNCDSWDLALDLVRFENKGEICTGLVRYSDMIVVFQKTQISVITGSSNRDLFAQTIVSGEGCASGFSIQEVESRRYGNILVFLGNDGTLKGFNGTKNLIKLGEPIAPLMRTMNQTRLSKAVSANYKKLGQYWCTLTYASGTQNDQVIIYDYINDYHQAESGRPLSTCLYYTGIKANCMAIWTASSVDLLVTGNYNGFVIQQDSGNLDEETTAIRSNWLSSKIDFGAPQNVKLLSDCNLVTTQSTTTNMSLNAVSEDTAGSATLNIAAAGGLWGSMIWGTDLWTAASTTYTRAELTMTDPDLEGGVYGRYIQFQFVHAGLNETVEVEELILGVTDLGHQPEYVEI